MANFRNGNLVQGQTLGASYLTVELTENHQVVNVGANQVVFLRSDSDIASDRDFEIVSSTIQGQQVVFVFESDSPKACQLLYTPGVGNVRITSLWAPAKFDAITLSWDGQFWVEVSRSNVSSGGGFDPTITSPVTGDVLIYNGADWINNSISGDASLLETGELTIGPSRVSISKCAKEVVGERSVGISQIQILTLDTTPVTLLTANPINNIAYIVNSVNIVFEPDITPFVCAGTIDISYTGGQTLMSIPASSVLTAVSPVNIIGSPSIYTIDLSGAQSGVDIITAGHKSVVMSTSSPVTGGGGLALMSIIVNYRTITF